MKIIITFTILASALFIGAYYLLVRHYYWGAKVSKKENDQDKRPN